MVQRLIALLEPDFGEPIEHYEAPLTEDEEMAFDAALDAVEPAHAAAAARLHSLFAG